MVTVVFEHGPYCLSCEPVRKPDGQFCAMVIITRRVSGVMVVSRTFPPRECFGRAEEAVQHARRWVIDWIDLHDTGGMVGD
ncbi:hypothetical protein [Burkholderia sp. WAC0059]|uniref:hypothetical protein n=1 Tax=Burkholderia sp. WAC0059 TaxID=2066022 RepID=UPI0011AF09B7|nr:hypothetical protein [Burkholderia sp. WAC0059]